MGICHDVGHPGVNNAFLVETAHELAIRYNDNSCLENMHCAKMFELLRQPLLGVFDDLSETHKREVRTVAIEAIIHTDFAHHFSLARDTSMIYDSNCDMLDTINEMYNSGEIKYPAKETVNIFCGGDTKRTMRNMLLHFCDVSNPAKPWKLCEAWSDMVLEEFFNQGDREAELGLTVQPLNDRS